ncbi:protein timeless homolog [Glandiceps talaboti]
MPELMNCELLATCNALGFCEGSTYHKEPDCLETVRDLIRFLRREDDTREIRRQLGYAQIVQNDLIPIIKGYSEDDELFETVIRLLVNLSQPTELCFGNKIPEDKTFRHYFLEVQNQLQACKEYFADEEFMAVLARQLKTLLDMEWEDRREEHTLLMERILLLVRNILHVPADPNEEKRTDDDASVHDQVLWAMNTSGMDKLVLYIASAEGEQQWCMHAIEIISLMLREHEPEQLAKAGVGRSTAEKQKDDSELAMMRIRDQAERKSRLKQYSTRHSRFGGTFRIKDVKSISDNDLLYHRSPINIETLSFDREKAPGRKPRHRRPMKDDKLTRRSTLSIRLFLKEFCVLFLENCYNPIMHAVKDNLLHERAQKNDETYYLWAMRFFTEFSRHYQFRVDVISETFSVQSFHYIENNLQSYYEMMLTDKKEITQWSRRMHLALKAYGELLMTLDTMGYSKDQSLVDSANVMKSNIFYVMEYREIFVTLLRKYDPIKMPQAFLKDLVETSHVFVKMLEKFSRGRTSVMVQKRRRKKKKKQQRQNNSGGGQGDDGQLPQDELDELWDRVTSDLSTMLQGREEIPENVVPFDAAADIAVEEQRANAMIQIQQVIHNGQPGDAIALLRAAREVWPENDIFGAADIGPEDEFMALREIHYANLPRLNQGPAENEEEMNEEEEIDEEEEEGIETVRSEESFNFEGYVKRFSHPGVLKAYVTILANYRKNSLYTNHCIIKMLHRVAWDCKMVPLLFQLSLFRVFQKIVTDPAVSSPHLKEAAKFAKFVMGHFFTRLENNKKLFVEILFWKDHKEVYELDEGYGTAKDIKRGGGGTEWKEEEEEELRQLYEEYRDKDDEDEGTDVVDRIMEHIIDDTKSRRQIINQMVRQGLVHSAADLRKKSKKKRPLWREEQELELRTLFDNYRESDDVLGNILENMTDKRSKGAVTKKILEMGLVMDKKELYKRRKRKSDQPRKKKQKEGFINDDDDDDDEEENEYEEQIPSDDDDDDDKTDSNRESGSDSNNDNEDNGDNLGRLSLPQQLFQVCKQGFTEQVKWILTGLRRTADDREEEGDTTAVPIVPLSEENEQAMESNVFTSFLKKMGLAPPSDHQEIFWRIPADFTPDDLRDLADSIEGMGEGDDSEGQGQRKKSSARHNKLKELANARKKDRKAEEKEKRRKRLSEKKAIAAVVGEGDGLDETRKSMTSGKKKQRRVVKRDLIESSEDERFESEKTVNLTSSLQQNSDRDEESGSERMLQKKQNRMISSDSESDNDVSSKKSHKNRVRKEKQEKRKPKRISAEQARKVISDEDDDDDDDDVDKDVARRTNDEKKNTSKSKRVPSSDSDSDLDKQNKYFDNSFEEKKSTLEKASPKILSGDSDSDDEPLSRKVLGNDIRDDDQTEETPVPEDTMHMNLRLSSLDSDDEVQTNNNDDDDDDDDDNDNTAAAKKPVKRPYTAVPSDSDSDEEENIPLKRVVRRKIESDSDDDD